jgi:peptide/nickel transport system permease protein
MTGGPSAPVPMKIFVLRRILSVFPILLVVSFLSYGLLRATPGDYFSKFEGDPTWSSQRIAQERHRSGLDRDWVTGYVVWLKGALRFDFGYSFERRAPVWGLIKERLGNSFVLYGSALLLTWLLAIPLGVTAATRPRTWVDGLFGFLSYFGLSVPRVFLALLMVLFAAKTGWFPVGDMKSVTRWDSFSLLEKTVDVGHHLVLPTLVLAVTGMAGYMRQMRAATLECLSQDYVRTARAKGLPERAVIYRHTVRNAVNPLITLFGYSVAYMLSGSFLTEVVMNWPGMARLVVDGLFAQDEPLVMAAVLMAAGMLVLGNLVADILLAFADPRVRVS